MNAPSSLEFGTPDRVEWHLENWRRYQAPGKRIDDRLCNGHSGTPEWSGSTHFEDMEDECDLAAAQAVDAIIDDLHAAHPAQCAALYHAYLYAVFRFHSISYARALGDAKLAVGVGLVRKGIY